MDFTSIEQEEGIRFVWNNLPTSRLEVLKNIIPISLLYTPFFTKEDPILQVYSSPLTCSNCQWIASTFCPIDYNTMKFDCINCNTRSPLSSQYQNLIAEGYTIPEFQVQNSIIEYVLTKPQEEKKPFLFFIVDNCLSEIEFEQLQKCLIRNIENLEGVYVGLITLSKHVYLHDLTSVFLKEVIISGSKEYTKDELQKLLNLKEAIPNTLFANQYIQKIENCKEKILKILRRLRPSQFEVKKTNRALRATGQAFLTAFCVIESFGGIGGRLIPFIGGPCTIGSGIIIQEELTAIYRNHNDLEGNTDIIYTFQKSQKFYDDLIKSANQHSVSVDLFAFCLTQFGMGEMRNLIEKTGGIIMNEEEFVNDVFEKSLEKYMNFVTEENSVYGAKIKIECSKELYVSGILGPCQLIEKTKDFPTDGENLIGETGGNFYYLNSPINTSTYNIFFSHKQASIGVKQKPCFFQFKTNYLNFQGQMILRVATFMREFWEDEKKALTGFDQESAIATIARLAAWKGETIEVVDLVYWLNSVLIKFVRRFATFTPNKAETFFIPNGISLLPQFMFYFRKSYFVQKFGTSIDESALYKLTLYRENLTNMLVMIQPALFAYDLETQQPNPVLCELDSLKPEIVILVDTYFNVLIWHGSSIHAWVQEKYHLMEDYEHLKNILEQSKEDAALIVEDRLPIPRVISCYQGSPQERILKSKLNPTSNQSNFGIESENYITDDVSLKKFMDYLINLVVKQNQLILQLITVKQGSPWIGCKSI